MAPIEGRVARPEQRWGCRHGTPRPHQYFTITSANWKLQRWSSRGKKLLVEDKFSSFDLLPACFRQKDKHIAPA